MLLAEPDCHRLLNYIAAMAQQRYTMTVSQARAYEKAEERSRTIKGSSGWMDMISRPMAMYERALGITPDRVETVKPLDWLHSVGWIEKVDEESEPGESSKIAVTALGRAALAALDEAEAAETIAPGASIVLDNDDPIAFAKAIGKLSELGPTALVDPFFRAEHLLDISAQTEVTRILTGPVRGSKDARLTTLEQALKAIPDLSIEIRVDEENRVHDRYAIADDRSALWQIGSSMNGIGKRFSAMIEVKDPTLIEAIATKFSEVWESSDVLEPPTAPEEESDELSPPADASRPG